MSSTPVSAMDDRRATRQVIGAARYAVPKRTLTFHARVVEVLENAAPNFSAWLWKQLNRLLPRPVSGQGSLACSGLESRAALPPFWITRLGDRAAVRNNELEPEMNL